VVIPGPLSDEPALLETERESRRFPSPIYFQVGRVFSMKAEDRLTVRSEILLSDGFPFTGSLDIDRISPGNLELRNSFADEACNIDIGGVIVPPQGTVLIHEAVLGSVIIGGERIRQFLIASSEFD
jgi:hypothetical protein